MTLGGWSGGSDALAGVRGAVSVALPRAAPRCAGAIREHAGRDALFLLMLTVMVSDTAQYYTGRAFGRRPLAPASARRKRSKARSAGSSSARSLLAVVGAWWLPRVPVALRALLGVAIVALGIAGDLFESMLKRSAGVKDSSALIPGPWRHPRSDRRAAVRRAVYYIVSDSERAERS